jgi:hypothetical protein
VSVSVVSLLLKPDEVEAAVIEHDDRDREVFTGKGKQFHAGHGQASVTDHGNDLSLRGSQGGSYGSRKSKAHGLEICGKNEPPGRKYGKMPPHENLMKARVRNYDGIPGEFGSEDLEELLDRA